MSALAQIAIHPSQFPDAVRLDLLESLRTRQINHKFHYDSLKQTQKWLALHQAYSPSRTDPDCAATYQASFVAAEKVFRASVVHLIGLGCGGGQKDTALLRLLHNSSRQVYYTPSDVSVAMVLVARQASLEVVGQSNCFPLVCDLNTASDLPSTLAELASDRGEGPSGGKLSQSAQRLFTFFGMIPNFEPDAILPKLAALLEREDRLLFSANLAPGIDYAAGVAQVLPLYNNALTKDWLITFLLDLGIEQADGHVSFAVEDQHFSFELKRIVAFFHFRRDRVVALDSERFAFRAGDSIRLFFSYRHTPGLIRTMLNSVGLEVVDQWVTQSQEEGVFLVRKPSNAD